MVKLRVIQLARSESEFGGVSLAAQSPQAPSACAFCLRGELKSVSSLVESWAKVGSSLGPPLPCANPQRLGSYQRFGSFEIPQQDSGDAGVLSGGWRYLSLIFSLFTFSPRYWFPIQCSSLHRLILTPSCSSPGQDESVR